MQDTSNNPSPVRTPTVITLSSSSPTGRFSNNPSGPFDGSTTTVVVPAGESSVSFYYSDTKSGSPTIVGAESPDVGWTNASQQEKVLPGPIAQLAFVGEVIANEPDVASDMIVVETQDRYGNPSPVGDITRLDLTTTSLTGHFDLSRGGLFDGSINSVGLPLGESFIGFFYEDSTLGSPQITVRENPSRGWKAATQTRTITLTLTVNNMGSLAMTTVAEEGWTAEERMKAVSANGSVGLIVLQTTKALKRDGSRVELITVEPILPSPPTPKESKTVATTVELQPAGATFNPPLELVISYAGQDLPPNVNEKELYISYWNGTDWISLPSTVDPNTKTVSANISHFSIYSVISPVRSGNDFLWQFILAGTTLLLLSSTGFLMFAPKRALALAAYSEAISGSNKAIDVQVLNSARQPMRLKKDMTVILSTDVPGGTFDIDKNGSFSQSKLELKLSKGTIGTTFFYQTPSPGNGSISVRVKRGFRWKVAKMPLSNQ